MLRELCYDQDLFLIQSCLVLSEDPDIVLISIIDRFQLHGWFNGVTEEGPYDAAQLISMVEELLYVVITILSEHANPRRISLAQAIRREIIHALAVGACPYTDLIKRVAERMVDDVCFDHVLREVAHFRQPEATNDFGTYELKEEAYEEVNPFFYHYTRNKREEVEAVLKARLKKSTGESDPVVIPKPMSIANGPFLGISKTFDSHVLLRIIFHTIGNVITISEAEKKPPQSSEAILDQAIHLTMLAIVERGPRFIEMAASQQILEGTTLLSILCKLHNQASFKTYKPRIKWIIQNFEIHVPNEVAIHRVVTTDVPLVQDDDLNKRRAAKARQHAILKQMKAQQSSFAMNLADFDDDDDEETADSESHPISFGTCIVCQEKLDQNRGFGALGMIQPSRFLRKQPDSSTLYINEVLLASESMDRVVIVEDATSSQTYRHNNQGNDIIDGTRSPFVAFPNHSTKFGLYASVCSHMMHLDCFQVYNISIKHRHRAQGQRNHPECIARKEYICPLCKSLGNVVLPVEYTPSVPVSSTPFSEWVRSVGITILKSKPDVQLDALQSKSGTGEFVFWAAQDAGYVPFARADDGEGSDWHKMLDTLVVVAKSFSQQTRHLRERPEPDSGERGSGLYLPEDLVGYTISVLEVSQRGVGEPNTLLTSTMPETTMQMIRGLVGNLTRLAAIHFRDRPDSGRDSIRQAIIKRLLPEWSRTSLTSLPYPLLLRDPLTILVETAAVAPEMLRHVLIPLYYVCLARSVIGLVFSLSKIRIQQMSSIHGDAKLYQELFGDVRMFCMSVVRQAPVLEHTANIVLECVGIPKFQRLIYTFTLPFLRRAMILCKAMLPEAFPDTTGGDSGQCEYQRLLSRLGIPPLASLPGQDTLKTLLFGWCSHYGQSHTASQLNCGITLEYPAVYRLADLPPVLDCMFSAEKPLVCLRCETVPVDSAVCLICGSVCCLQSHCCKDLDGRERGECNIHTRESVTQSA